MDEEGTFIECSCLHKVFERFIKHWVVDECLYLHKPSLAKNTGKFNVKGNSQKLSLFGLWLGVETEAFGAKWSKNETFQQIARYRTTVPSHRQLTLSSAFSTVSANQENPRLARPCHPQHDRA